MVTSIRHDEILKDTIKILKEKGYKVIDLERKCPDAIAVKINDNGEIEINAVEVLSQQYDKKKGANRGWTYNNKRLLYRMFDNIFFSVFFRGGDWKGIEKIKSRSENGKLIKEKV